MLPRRQFPKVPSGMFSAMKESHQAIFQTMEDDFVRINLADIMSPSTVPLDAIVPTEQSNDDLKGKETHSPLYEKFLKHSALIRSAISRCAQLTKRSEQRAQLV